MPSVSNNSGSNANGRKRRRFKHQCPRCWKLLSNLPEHLVNVHGIPSLEAKYVVQNSKMSGRNYPDKEGPPLKSCKVEGCKSAVVHMTKHLRQIHNIYVKPRRQKRHNRRLAVHDAQATQYMDEIKDLSDKMALWLQTADGGRSSENTAVQHASQLRFLVSTYSPKNLIELLDSNKICAQVESRVSSGEWKANTAKLYYGSLKYFLMYMLDQHNVGEIPIPCTETRQKMSLILEKIPRWKTSFRKTVVQQKTELFEDKKKRIHSKSRIDQYMDSDEFKLAKSIMSELSTKAVSVPLSRTQYTAVVRCLLSLISIRAPKRAGVLGSLLLKDFSKAECVDNDTYNMILTGSHKTFGPTGSAVVPITAGTRKWLKIYIKKIRSQIETRSDKKRYLFLRYNGKKFNSGEISKMLSLSFESAGLPSTNATIFRKSSTTESYKCDANGEGPSIMACLLDHDEGTGRREYNLFKKDERANRAAAYNESLMFSRPLDVSLSFDTVGESEHEVSVSCKKASESTNSDSDVSAADALEQNASDTDTSVSEGSGSSDSESADKTFKRRTSIRYKQRRTKESFSSTSLSLLKNNCKSMIEGSAKITEKSLHSCDISSVISNHGTHKVMAKLRYLRLKFRN